MKKTSRNIFRLAQYKKRLRRCGGIGPLKEYKLNSIEDTSVCDEGQKKIKLEIEPKPYENIDHATTKQNLQVSENDLTHKSGSDPCGDDPNTVMDVSTNLQLVEESAHQNQILKQSHNSAELGQQGTSASEVVSLLPVSKDISTNQFDEIAIEICQDNKQGEDAIQGQSCDQTEQDLIHENDRKTKRVSIAIENVENRVNVNDCSVSDMPVLENEFDLESFHLRFMAVVAEFKTVAGELNNISAFKDAIESIINEKNRAIKETEDRGKMELSLLQEQFDKQQKRAIDEITEKLTMEYTDAVAGFLVRFNEQNSNMSVVLGKLEDIKTYSAEKSKKYSESLQHIEMLEKQVEDLKAKKAEMQIAIDSLKRLELGYKRESELQNEAVGYITRENQSLKKDIQQAERRANDYQARYAMIATEVKGLDFGVVFDRFVKLKVLFVQLSTCFNNDILTIRNQLESVKNEMDALNSKYTEEIDRLKRTGAESELKLVSERDGYMQTASALKEENSELIKKANKQDLANIDLADELRLKTEFIGELETNAAEMQRENAFLRKQLIDSDILLQNLKNNKFTIDSAYEIQKIRKRYEKEITLLKLKIEEYELDK